MKKSLLQLSMYSLVLLLFSQCTPSKETTSLDFQYSDLGLETYEELHIKGQNEFKNYWITYEIQEAKDGRYDLSIQIGEKTIDARVGYAPMYLEQIADNIVLDEAEKLALTDFADKFSLLLADNNKNKENEFTITAAENALYRLTDFWSNAPKGFVYQSRVATINLNKGTGNDGITCIQTGNSYTLKYTRSNGSVVTRTRTAGYNGGGSYNCMGRCGANCGRWWIPSSWTLDCFEHDECSLHLNASGGASDPNCGDEFWNASDDWTFGVGAGCWG